MTQMSSQLSIALIIAILCLGVVTSGEAKIDEDTILGVWLFDEDIKNTVRDASGMVMTDKFLGSLKLLMESSEKHSLSAVLVIKSRFHTMTCSRPRRLR